MNVWRWVMDDPRTARSAWARRHAQNCMVRDYFRRVLRATA